MVLAFNCVSRIFHYRELVFLGEPKDDIHVTRVAIKVNW
jgi:hypothetical protein